MIPHKMDSSFNGGRKNADNGEGTDEWRGKNGADLG